MRNSNGTYDKVVTIRVVTHGDPEQFDWDTLLDIGPEEKVELVKVVNTEDYK